MTGRSTYKAVVAIFNRAVRGERRQGSERDTQVLEPGKRGWPLSTPSAIIPANRQFQAIRAILTSGLPGKQAL